VFDVCAARRRLRRVLRAAAALSCSASRASRSAHAAAAEELFEDVAEIRRVRKIAWVDFFNRHIRAGVPALAPSAGGAAAEIFERIAAIGAGMSELIVILPFLLIGENVVRLLDLFESLLRLLVALVDVGVVLTNEFAVRLFDFIGAGRLRDSENFVIIALCHGLGSILARVACNKYSRKHRLIRGFPRTTGHSITCSDRL
jgi:hypothetical protein